MMASSSWDHEKSALFSSERGSLESVPFSNGNEKRICKDTAGDRSLESNSENPMENLDGLTEEELDELLQEAWEINQRLKSFERKHNSRSRGDQGFAEEKKLQEYKNARATAERNPFLPPLEQTKTSLVAGVKLVEGTKSDLARRHKKASVV